MRATEAATNAYHDTFPALYSTVLGRTGLRVSGAGFGSYRVSTGIEAHRLALRKALTSGINLIDTSANYTDGGSEELIGATIAELIDDGKLARREVVVVTKGGYIQGSNYTMAVERVQAGGGFPDVVEYGKGLWHCIAPEFLSDQIDRSLSRLRLSAIDVYLLHNPEYYLSWAAREGLPLEEARAEYYRRIREAFAYLETEVERGRIGWYGISSNSFPHRASDADFTSLEEVARIAERISLVNHFAVIQFPANLFERGFVTERNQPDDRALIEVARERNLGVLINRPLNAIVEEGLIRLADFPQSETPFDAERIGEMINTVIASERAFLERTLSNFEDDPQGSEALRRFVSVGATMQEHWESFGAIEHYNDVLSQHFAPRFSYVVGYLRDHGDQKDLAAYERCVNDARALLHAVAAYYAREAQARSTRIRGRIAETVEQVEGTLSSLSVRLLLGVEGVDCVLVGMRREGYVDDAVEALRRGPLGSRESLTAITLP